MRTIVVTCVALLSACAALGVEVAALPDAVFADTEVSTNFTFAVGEGNNRRLVFSLELQAVNTIARRLPEAVSQPRLV